MWRLSLFLLLSGCASQREAQLQAIKDTVDNRIEYEYAEKKLADGEYLGGPDRRGNCTDYMVSYQKDAKAKGIDGHAVLCKVGQGIWHTAFRTNDGYILDNRKTFIYEGDTCVD